MGLENGFRLIRQRNCCGFRASRPANTTRNWKNPNSKTIVRFDARFGNIPPRLSITSARVASNLWPLAVYSLLVVLLTGAMLAASYFLGQRHRDRHTGLPYEGGVSSVGDAHIRLSARFYLVAMFFVVFDLEAVFIFLWAVVAREAGWAGYVEIVVFIGVLIAALAYLWALKALDWGELKKQSGTEG
jgi:NADH-quinone oxidoreductase subunit A